MTVHIQYLHMQTSESLIEIITLNLEKLANKYPFILRGDVSIKLGNAHDRNDKICEIELSAPGPRILAKSNTDNFEKSAAETINDLERQLIKREI